ncbi:alpha/beta hydrolase [Notoacmeibacter ruber]|uniref:Palmitoyl-protein thioesterase ABHD10, mitochondrial n=1 Tax=Notoacmeibacter ruber TaxID=2670375 RepID=A0A3L7JGA5_9HYPH|nr:alpha/beta hydrolase [Notoacmeibacter ruber]RLQ89239.1 alpha/beta hydrolase [Notoacmeibacter ruber]
MPEEQGRLTIDGTPIAWRRVDGASPTFVWLGGFRSDMAGTKAEAISNHCAETGHAFLRFDYSGHGESGGDFEAGTISLWLSETLAVLDRLTDGPLVLVGSSMGGWIALRAVQEMVKAGETDRIAGMILLAPAPDFTSRMLNGELTAKEKKVLEETGRHEVPTPYGPDPNVFTKKLFDDGEKNSVLNGLIDTHCPVHIVQGMEDPDVPWQTAQSLMERLPADDVTLTYVKDGDHRLSREQDIALLLRVCDTMAEQVSAQQGA